MIKVGDIVTANQNMFKELPNVYEEVRGKELTVLWLVRDVATIAGGGSYVNVYTNQIDPVRTARCFFCEENLDKNNPPKTNQSKTRICCESCWNKNYFLEKKDNRIYLRKMGIQTDCQGFRHKKYCTEYTCVVDGKKFWAVGNAQYWLDNGPVEQFHVMNGDVVLCCGSHYVLAKNTEMIDGGIRMCSRHKKDFEYTCSITGKIFYSTNPMELEGKFVSEEGWNKLLDYGKLKKCVWCGAHFVPQKNTNLLRSLNKKEIALHGSHDARMAVAKVNNICHGCLCNMFPLVYDQLPEIDGVGRTIGIEIECNPTLESQNKLVSWMVGGQHMVGGGIDNSLRGAFPAEFKSPILHESNYEVWVNDLCEKLEATVYNRCGLHIHIGTHDFKWIDISRLMAYCSRWEKYFFSLVSRSRRVANGAAEGAGLPQKLPEGFADAFLEEEDLMMYLYGKKKLTQDELANRRANDQDGPRYEGAIHRYQWANFHGHFHKMAVEIRLHHGTTNPTKIKNWIEFWLCIFDFVKSGGDLSKHPREVIPVHLRSYYDERAKMLESSIGKVVFK